MAHWISQYLCCCLPSSRDHHAERQPLLDPDVLPAAPPRPPPSRSTEQQQAEQAMRRRILHDASERLINVSSPHPFTSSRDSLPPSPSASRPSSPSPSRSGSSTPTLTSPSRRHTLTSRSRSRASTWRPPADGPLAPVRVVHLGQNWEVLNPEGALAEHGSGAGATQNTPATRRRTRRGRVGQTASRPPSSHSMRTLPRGGGGGQPSPLRRDLAGWGTETGYGGDEGDEYEEDDDEGADVESRFGTMTSYRTANSGDDDVGVSSSYGTTRTGLGLRDMWGTVVGGEVDAGDDDPARKEELARALAALESSIDTWTLHPVGPIVADLDEVAAAEERGSK
ncbi:hypothetical protein JCM1840_002434 [Sporobolomyces johnsonii]